MKFKLRRYVLYYAGRVLAFLIALLPLRAALSLAGFAGSVAYAVLPQYRLVTLRNLEYVFAGQKSREEIRAIAKNVFVNLAKNAVEMLNFPKLSASNIDRFVRIVNIDVVNSALAKGHGIVVVTGHFGNWELMPATLRIKGYAGSVIGRRIYFEKYDQFLNSLRKCHGVDVIYRDESPRKVLKVLKNNGIMGVVADQDVDSVDGVFVDFFGHPAYTPAGPVALAKVSGAALIPAFMIRSGDHHRLVFENPVNLVDTGDKEKDMVTNTQAWSSVIEDYIRRYPDQWVWMHRRWKTKIEKK